MEQKLSTTTTTYPTTTLPTLTDEEVGGRKGGRTSENSVTLTLMLIELRIVCSARVCDTYNQLNTSYKDYRVVFTGVLVTIQ